jgi:folate-binding Fe-S cluster repair protein YgfZ
MATTLQPAELTTASQSAAAELDALLHAKATAPLGETGWIRVTGSDRVRWLNGMVTNGIQQLATGEGCYNFVLNAQGRIQGDLTAFMLEDSILLETGRDQVPALLAHFDRFIIMDDVELADISDQRRGTLIAGPQALRALQELGGTPCSESQLSMRLPATISLMQTVYRGAPVHLIQAYSPLVPRFEVWADSEVITQIFTELASIPVARPSVLEALRILEGQPLYGVDIRNTESAKDLPQLLRQEIVERIRSRGNVHRTFSGFVLEGTVPAAGTVLLAEGKPVGELTSVAAIALPSGPVQLALGYIRRETLDRRLILEYSGGSATPIELPYEGIS